DGGSWLPQPASWGELSVEAQTGVPGSTLEMYRSALAVRREQADLGAGDSVEWLRAPEGVLAFRRGDFVCVANTTGESVTVPSYGRVLISNAEVAETASRPRCPRTRPCGGPGPDARPRPEVHPATFSLQLRTARCPFGWR